MPKLNSRPPKYCKLGKYAVVYFHGKINYLGRHGTPESKVAYSRFVAEIQANPIEFLPKEEKLVTVRELAAAFLDHVKADTDLINYGYCRIAVLDFLDKLYGDGTLIEDFTPRCLKLVRDEMIRSGRFCRRSVNDYTFRIISVFSWGVGNDLVPETTWRALKAIKTLKKGSPDTFDHEEREAVSDDVVRRTLPFMPPTLRAMVQLQRILGMRPNKIFKMRVGDIDTTRENGLWYYVPGSYKTAKFVGKIVFPLGKPEQELIAPYLAGKTSESAVFSPRTAMQERNAERRANRKTKIIDHQVKFRTAPSSQTSLEPQLLNCASLRTKAASFIFYLKYNTPSQAARNEERAAKPTRYAEFYNRNSYQWYSRIFSKISRKNGRTTVKSGIIGSLGGFSYGPPHSRLPKEPGFFGLKRNS